MISGKLEGVKKRLFIVGIVGVPGNYGGFETLAENLVDSLTQDKRNRVTVFCDRNFVFDEFYKPTVSLVRLPFSANGAQSIPYDLLGMTKAASQSGTILVLGTSATIFIPILKLLFPKSSFVVNLAGLEWQREKWGFFARQYLKLGERAAVRYSDKLVVDNQGLFEYVNRKYGATPSMIPYGGDQFLGVKIDEEILKKFDLQAKKYDIAIARAQPDNNIEMVLDAYSRSKRTIVFVSNWESSKFGLELFQRYRGKNNIKLIGPIYNPIAIHTLRSSAALYIHGHSAGGTNPTLVEAMHSELPILAFDVNFNRFTTENQARYFRNSESLLRLLDEFDLQKSGDMAAQLKAISEKKYCWVDICNSYKKLLFINS